MRAGVPARPGRTATLVVAYSSPVSNARLLRRKLAKRRVWQRIFVERLTEPVHLNLMSLGVLAFGSFRSKVNWDLVVRPHYAFGVLKAADLALAQGVSRVGLVEFGVASGAGLMNLATIADAVTRETGVHFDVHGFDTGTGMPPAVDYRDHPDLYQEGDFAMDPEGLRAVLPPNAHLHLGPLHKTIPTVLAAATSAPIGFVSLDVDYYSSTVEALRVFAGPADGYLPLVVVYADDIALDSHNSACGELLAIREFNDATPMRRIEHHPFLENARIFRRPGWLKQILFAHILDHPARSTVAVSAVKRHIENPYLPHEELRENFTPGLSPR